MAKGWFQVPGIRPEGDRTLEEQIMGLRPALDEAKGKTVLDLGCAEGLISLEFAKAEAASVRGIELLGTHLDVARLVCAPFPQVKFKCIHLSDYIAERDGQPMKMYDIVLALGIIHKLPDPGIGMAFAARSASDLLLFRAPAKAGDGIVASKHTGVECNVPKIMEDHGFFEEKLIPGVRGEAVQYWRRLTTNV